jgi:hypothetical protein
MPAFGGGKSRFESDIGTRYVPQALRDEGLFFVIKYN